MNDVAPALRDNTTIGILPDGRVKLGSLLLIICQLALAAVVIYRFQIESGAFLKLALLAFAGFAVHALLPMAWRLPFFLALSVAGILMVLDVASSLWLFGIGLALIGICHLPFSFRVRGALLVAATVLLAVMRGKWLPSFWSDAVWPILGSMFMFRLIVYFYDLRHDPPPTSTVRALSYFFMLPNVCFPLFPVIDYRKFSRNYYDDDSGRIYQTGVDWIARGLVHLIIYRLVYYYLTLAPHEVHDPADFGQYVLSNFLLYLRVSGQFHLVIGMLYLFGFRLPETHHLYYFASSFTDFWRRINIYWKDFMLKVFYNPAYFWLRRFGHTTALVLATIFVFAMTWSLHAWQWFWLRGTYLLVWQDVLFWTILGLLVVVNSLYEARFGRRRSLGKSASDWRVVSTVTLKTAATFCFICILWSFWTSESIATWLEMWSAFGQRVAGDPGNSAGVFAAAMLGIVGVARAASTGGKRPGTPTVPSRARAAAATIGMLLALGVLSVEQVSWRFGENADSVIQSLRSGRLSRLDNAQLERGYYEQLLSVDRFNSQLWQAYINKPRGWLAVEAMGLARPTGDFALTELAPDYSAKLDFGSVTINRWGMRDRDYEVLPPDGVFRIALLGMSTVMGWGVDDGQTFEAILERRLNAEAGGQAYEILNMAVYGYQPPQQLVVLDKAISFKPDSVFYVAAGREVQRSNRFVAEAIRKGVAIPYGPIRDIVQRSGVDGAMDETAALRGLEPYGSDLLAYVYSQLVERSRSVGAVPVYIYLPPIRQVAPWQEEAPQALRLAREAGFTILDLSELYKGRNVTDLYLAEWDLHPNVQGHRLIAEALYQAIDAQRAQIFASAGGDGRAAVTSDAKQFGETDGR